MEVFGSFLKARNEDGILGVLIEEAIDVLVENELDVLAIHVAERRSWYVFHGEFGGRGGAGG